MSVETPQFIFDDIMTKIGSVREKRVQLITKYKGFVDTLIRVITTLKDTIERMKTASVQQEGVTRETGERITNFETQIEKLKSYLKDVREALIVLEREQDTDASDNEYGDKVTAAVTAADEAAAAADEPPPPAAAAADEPPPPAADEATPSATAAAAPPRTTGTTGRFVEDADATAVTTRFGRPVKRPDILDTSPTKRSSSGGTKKHMKRRRTRRRYKTGRRTRHA